MTVIGDERGDDLVPTGARLLLVDDHEDTLELLTVMLGEKYRVWSFGSAAEALRALEAVQPDLLVLDIGMAPVDGVQCLEAIRTIPAYAGLPAIALTAFAREVEQKVFLGGGFQAVVTKPILDYQRLFALIDTLLESAASGGRGGARRQQEIGKATTPSPTVAS